MKTVKLLALALLFLSSCSKEDSELSGDNADRFVGTYSITEKMVQTYGGSQTNNETFPGSITKVDATHIQFTDTRTPNPVYSIAPYKLVVSGDSTKLGTVKGLRYGKDSIVLNWEYGTGTKLYSVKWVCK